MSRSAKQSGGGSGDGRVRRYSVWLAFSGREARSLSAVIRRLARTCGTTPFEPHVTLLGGIRLTEADAGARFGRLAGHLRRRGAFRLRLGGVAGEPRYFRCLYVHVVRDRRLAAVRRRAVRLFALQGGSSGRARPRFHPHLSLAYGRLPAGLRRRLAAEVGDRLEGSALASRLLLVRTGRDFRRWRVVLEVDPGRVQGFREENEPTRPPLRARPGNLRPRIP